MATLSTDAPILPLRQRMQHDMLMRGLALGNQVGENRLARIFEDADFSNFRRAAETRPTAYSKHDYRKMEAGEMAKWGWSNPDLDQVAALKFALDCRIEQSSARLYRRNENGHVSLLGLD